MSLLPSLFHCVCRSDGPCLGPQGVRQVDVRLRARAQRGRRGRGRVAARRLAHGRRALRVVLAVCVVRRDSRAAGAPDGHVVSLLDVGGSSEHSDAAGIYYDYCDALLLVCDAARRSRQRSARSRHTSKRASPRGARTWRARK